MQKISKLALSLTLLSVIMIHSLLNFVTTFDNTIWNKIHLKVQSVRSQLIIIGLQLLSLLHKIFLFRNCLIKSCYQFPKYVWGMSFSFHWLTMDSDSLRLRLFYVLSSCNWIIEFTNTTKSGYLIRIEHE